LVDNGLRRDWLFPEERPERLLAEQHYNEKRSGWVVQVGGCDGKAANCLPITKGWNYIIRYYSPAERDPGRHVEVSRSTASGLITCIGKS
jgi:hypothetical protein